MEKDKILSPQNLSNLLIYGEYPFQQQISEFLLLSIVGSAAQKGPFLLIVQ